MAHEFNATTDRITASGSTTVPATGSLSLWVYATWVKTDNEYRSFFEVANDANNYFDLGKAGTNEMYGGWVTGAEYRVIVASSGYSWTANAWNHAALTWDDDANSTLLYINGSQIGSASTLATFTTTGVKNLGNWDSIFGNVDMAGRLAEVAVWSRVLGSAEVAALYKGFTPAHFRRGGVHYWPLVRDLLDLWGGALGTSSGTAAAEHCRAVCPHRQSARSKNRPWDPFSRREAAAPSESRLEREQV